MEKLDFAHRTRLVFEFGGVRRLGSLAAELGCKRALMVSDPGVVSAGHFNRGREALKSAGLLIEAFHGVRENPSTADVDAGLAIARAFQPDLLVGLGGGSSMDCAKGINFLYSCGGKMEDYWGVGKATADMLPMIAVPTTAGTGSEAQSFALISQVDSHVKMACGDPRAACRIALLDPELTLTQPPRVTALTGVDAISHALESHVTLRRNSLSSCYSRRAWQLLSRGFPDVLANPKNIDARGQTQLGAFFAGLAIETSMLGAAHAMANPLTARFDVTHGQAVGMMLPHVIRYNAEHSSQIAGWYSELWQDLTSEITAKPQNEVSASILLADFVYKLFTQAGLNMDLQSFGIGTQDVAQLALDATKQWTGTFNPRPMQESDFKALYLNALSNK